MDTDSKQKAIDSIPCDAMKSQKASFRIEEMNIPIKRAEQIRREVVQEFQNGLFLQAPEKPDHRFVILICHRGWPHVWGNQIGNHDFCLRCEASIISNDSEYERPAMGRHICKPARQPTLLYPKRTLMNTPQSFLLKSNARD